MDLHTGRPININITPATIIKAVLVLLLFWFLYVMKDLVIVMLTALVIASAIEPLIRWMGKYHIARTLSVIAVYVLLIALFSGVFYFFVPSLFSDLSDLLSKLPDYVNTISVWNPFKGDFASSAPVAQSLGLADTFSLQDLVNSFNTTFIKTSQGFIETLAGIFGGVFSLILIVVLSFYLAVQEDGIAKFLRIVAPSKYEDYVVDLWRRSQDKIGRWLPGQLLLGILIGIMVYLGLMILGVRNALLLALLAAAFEIIPAFGPILAAIPSTMIALIDGGLTKGLLVVGFYVIIHQFENHLIYPLVVKKIVGIPPILVILALIVGFKVAGVLGIILSVPVAAVLVELLDDFQKQKVTNLHSARSA